MTYESRMRPHQIRPTDGDGSPVAANLPYGLQVVTGGPYGTEVDGLTPVLTGLTSADSSVALTDNGDGTVDLAAIAGGGSTNNDRRWSVGPGETSVDEFNDASISASFVPVNKTGTTANIAWTEAADVLSVATGLGTDTTGDFHALMLPLTSAGGSLVAGDAFETALIIGSTGTNYTFGGLCFANGATFGAGAQVAAVIHWGSTSQQDTLRSYTNYSSATGGSVIDTFTSVALGGLRYTRLVYLGANVWRRDLSFDGVTWIKGPNTLTLAITPTHVGLLASSWGTSTKGSISYQFLRRVSGIT